MDRNKKTENTPEIHADARLIDAFERRQAGGSADEVPPSWLTEVDEFVRVHRRVQAQPLPELPPSIRGVIMAAAVQATQAQEKRSLWSQIFAALLKPGPVLGLATATALAVALSVRTDRPAAPVQAPAAELKTAQQDQPIARQAAPASAAAVPADQQAAAPAGAIPPPSAGTGAPGAAADAPQASAGAAPSFGREVAGEPRAKADAPAAQVAASAPMPKPTRVIAAQPASLGPTDYENTQAMQQVAQDDAQMPVAPRGKAMDEENTFPQAGLAKGAAAGGRAGPAAQVADAAPPPAAEANFRRAAKAESADKKSVADRNEFASKEEKQATRQVAAPARAQDVGQAGAAIVSEQAKADGIASGDSAKKGKVDSDVAAARALVDKATDANGRRAALVKLADVAKRAGDVKNQTWAGEQLRALQEELARSRPAAQQQAPGGSNAAGSGKAKAAAAPEAPASPKKAD